MPSTWKLPQVDIEDDQYTLVLNIKANDQTNTEGGGRRIVSTSR